MEFNYVDYFVLPLLILMARVVDVSMDTVRVIMISKGYRKMAPFIGFFQALIWLITITRIMANLGNWVTYIGYAGGFGIGTYVGMKIEGKLALGFELVRIVTRADAGKLIDILRRRNFSVTSMQGRGRDGDVGIIYIILKRKAIEEALKIISNFNPKAFYTIEDVRFVSNHQELSQPGLPRRWRMLRTRVRT